MKKIALTLVVFIFGISLYSQSAPVSQRIIGSWKGDMFADSIVLTFNDNGIVTLMWLDDNDVESGRYFITDSALIINIDDDVEVFSYYFSQNGNVLVFGTDGDWVWLERQ